MRVDEANLQYLSWWGSCYYLLGFHPWEISSGVLRECPIKWDIVDYPMISVYSCGIGGMGYCANSQWPGVLAILHSVIMKVGRMIRSNT